MPAARPVEIRFWEQVRKTRGCWFWEGSLRNDGYGQISYLLKPILTHRLSYTLHCGKIPLGLCVLHKCDNRRCVKPEHLFLGTNLDNMRDMKEKRRHWGHTRPDEIKAHGNKCRKFLPLLRGEANPCSKLTVARIRLAKRLVERGFTRTAVAERFSVSRTALSLAISGKTWKHVRG